MRTIFTQHVQRSVDSLDIDRRYGAAATVAVGRKTNGQRSTIVVDYRL
jgi:hypothetical protein